MFPGEGLLCRPKSYFPSIYSMLYAVFGLVIRAARNAVADRWSCGGDLGSHRKGMIMTKVAVFVGLPVALALAVGFVAFFFLKTSAQAADPSPQQFLCYTDLEPAPLNGALTLQDQFDVDPVGATVLSSQQFCNPVASKSGRRLTLYQINHPPIPPRTAVVGNRFDPDSATTGVSRQYLRVHQAVGLFAPTRASETSGELMEIPPALDNFKCYSVAGMAVDVTVGLQDEFGRGEATVHGPRLLCNPLVNEQGGALLPTQHSQDHLVCYDITMASTNPHVRFMSNQFEDRAVTVDHPSLLCVPSSMRVLEPPPQPN